MKTRKSAVLILMASAGTAGVIFFSALNAQDEGAQQIMIVPSESRTEIRIPDGTVESQPQTVDSEPPPQAVEDAPVTRYEFAVVMARLVEGVRGGILRQERPPVHAAHGYADIPGNHWAENAVRLLVSEGMISEGGGRTFRGEEPVDRFTLAVALDRFVQNLEPHYKRQPREKTVNLERIRAKSEDGSREAMNRLATKNFLPFGSPVFEGPEPTIHPETMAAVFAQAVERIAYVLRKRDSDVAAPEGRVSPFPGG